MPANMASVAPINCSRLLELASRRANQVTPTMYSPMPPATTQFAAVHGAGDALMPKSTLRKRQLPIVNRTEKVRFHVEL